MHAAFCTLKSICILYTKIHFLMCILSIFAMRMQISVWRLNANISAIKNISSACSSSSSSSSSFSPVMTLPAWGLWPLVEPQRHPGTSRCLLGCWLPRDPIKSFDQISGPKNWEIVMVSFWLKKIFCTCFSREYLIPHIHKYLSWVEIDVEVPKVDPKVYQEGNTVEVALVKIGGWHYSGCNFWGGWGKIVAATLAAERWRPVLP